MSIFAVSVLAQPGPISEVTEQLLCFLQEQKVDARAAHHVALIIEELLTNLATHAACPDRPARVSITVEPSRVTGQIIDQAPPFDPQEAREPDLDATAEERRVGGLGLVLVRRFTSSLEYEHRNGENYTNFSVARG